MLTKRMTEPAVLVHCLRVSHLLYTCTLYLYRYVKNSVSDFICTLVASNLLVAYSLYRIVAFYQVVSTDLFIHLYVD